LSAFDVIVLGLGAAGSAAAYQLAKRGVRVLGLDRHAPPHDHGSSHGDTRITRCAIGEGAHYTPLALRSHAIWREIERRDALVEFAPLQVGFARVHRHFSTVQPYSHSSES